MRDLYFCSCIVIFISILGIDVVGYCVMIVLLGTMIMFDQTFLQFPMSSLDASFISFHQENSVANAFALCYLIIVMSDASK